MQDRAAIEAAQLPAPLRQRFLDSFARVGGSLWVAAGDEGETSVQAIPYGGGAQLGAGSAASSSLNRRTMG